MRSNVVRLFQVIWTFVLMFAGSMTSSAASTPRALVGRAVQARNLNADDQKLSFAGQYGGDVTAVHVVDGYGFIGMGPRLVIVDLRDATAPRSIGASTLLPELIEGIDIDGDMAYVVLGDRGLVVFDVSSKESPQLLSNLSLPGRSARIDVSGHTAFIANWYEGLVVIDVSDPRSPRQVGQFADAAGATDVQVVGSLAYMVNRVSFNIIDLTQISKPVLVSTVLVQGNNPRVDVRGGYAFVKGDSRDGAVWIINVDTIDRPYLSLQLPIYWSKGDVAVTDSVVLVVGSSDSTSDESGKLWIYDLRAGVGRAKAIASLDLPFAVESMVVDGDHVYLAARPAGLQVADIANLAKPRLVGRTSEPSGTMRLANRDNLVFAVGPYSGLTVVDVSDARVMSVVGRMETTGSPHDIAVQGQLALVADGYRGLRVIDVADPSRPKSMALAGTTGNAIAVALGNGFAYVIDYLQGLSVVDLRRPLNAGSVAVEPIPLAQDVAVGAGYAYVAVGLNGLQVVDIRNPSNPRLGSRLALPGEAVSVVVAAPYALVALGWEGVAVVDLSNAPRPSLAATLYTSSEALDVAFGRDGAFVTDTAGNVHVIDISDPRQPRVIDIHSTWGEGRSLVVDNGNVFVANGSGGVTVLKVANAAITLTPQNTGAPTQSGTTAATSTVTSTPNQPLPPTMSATVIATETPDIIGTAIVATLTARAPTPTRTRTPSRTPDRLGTGVAATLTALAPPLAGNTTTWLPYVGRQHVLRIPTATPTHTPTATSTPVECSVTEREPNDTTTQALGQPALCPDKPITGALSPVDDPGREASDLYSVLVDRSLVARFRLDASGIGAPVEYDLTLWRCTSSECSRIEHRGEVGRRIKEIVVALSAGTYFLGVHPGTGHRSDERYSVGWEELP